MEYFANIISASNNFLWSYVVTYFCLGSGLFFSFKLKLFQFKALKQSISALKEDRKYNDDKERDISNFQALTATIAGAVGLGNIAGVAVAIQMGGAGAVFWMWVTALIGMAVRYAETFLAIYYQETSEDGKKHFGGPIYYITKGLKKKYHFLAVLFAIFTMVGAAGTGAMYQSNQVSSILNSEFGIGALTSGIILAIIVAIVIFGGIKRISHVAEKLVPFMCIFYVGIALILIFMNIGSVPAVMMSIIKNAFIVDSMIGGGIGSVIAIGVQRAIFSNESGLGTTPIIYGAVKKSKDIAKQSSVSVLSPFIDTIIVCSATAFIILISGNHMLQPDKITGILLTVQSFSSLSLPYAAIFITIVVSLLAFSTMITWSYYGENSFSYLFGPKYKFIYKIFFLLAIIIGAARELSLIINVSDLLIALMVIPNVIALMLLRKVIFKNTFKK
ncbi:amino acid carrier protein [Rickettsiales bacterium]|nr:amino acid carrier protein [Rickettsiales bacterium]